MILPSKLRADWLRLVASVCCDGEESASGVDVVCCCEGVEPASGVDGVVGVDGVCCAIRARPEKVSMATITRSRFISGIPPITLTGLETYSYLNLGKVMQDCCQGRRLSL